MYFFSSGANPRAYPGRFSESQEKLGLHVYKLNEEGNQTKVIYKVGFLLIFQVYFLIHGSKGWRSLQGKPSMKTLGESVGSAGKRSEETRKSAH